jgi:hypothetical protein
MVGAEISPYTKEAFFEKLAQHLLNTGNENNLSGIVIRDYLVVRKDVFSDHQALTVFNELDGLDEPSRVVYSKLFSWYAMMRIIFVPIETKSAAKMFKSSIQFALEQPDFTKHIKYRYTLTK